jgi:polysaccharide biosynthesis transport protein
LKEFDTTNPLGTDSSGEMQFRDYLEIARRRKSWIGLTATAVFVATAVVAVLTPNIYRSETSIIVDPGQVPTTYVTPTVTTGIVDRLSTIRELVMSPSRLLRLREQLGLYPNMTGPGSDEHVVAHMQKAINVEIVEAGAQKLTTFKIAFTSGEPEETAKVANLLATSVIDENLKTRQRQSADTTNFLDSELQDTKKQLEEKEAELERIKRTFVMDLPESKQYHLEALNNFRGQLRTSQDRVAHAQQEKIYVQSLMASTNPTVDLDAETIGNSSPAQQQLQKLETQLTELQGRYGPSHPDVKKMQAFIQEQKAKVVQEAKNAPQVAEPVKPAHAARHNPVLETQMAQLDQEINDQTKVQAQLQDQINFHASKLEREPIFEQQIAGLMRDYDTLRGHYNRLLDKKLSAQMATALEDRQEGERFEILDAAKVPTHPAGPNRPLLIMAGLVGGLIGGIGLAMFVEMSDESIRSEHEAAKIFKKTILAGVPLIVTEGQVRLTRLRAVAAVVATIVLSTGLGFVLSYVKENLI